MHIQKKHGPEKAEQFKYNQLRWVDLGTQNPDEATRVMHESCSDYEDQLLAILMAGDSECFTFSNPDISLKYEREPGIEDYVMDAVTQDSFNAATSMIEREYAEEMRSIWDAVASEPFFAATSERVKSCDEERILYEDSEIEKLLLSFGPSSPQRETAPLGDLASLE